MTTEKRKPSLYITLSIIVIVTVVSIMSLHAIYDYRQTKSQTLTEMKDNARLSLVSLQKNTADLITAYAVYEYEHLIVTEIERRENFAIIIEDFNMGQMIGEDTFITGKIRNAQWGVVEYDHENASHNSLLASAFYFEQVDVISETGETIGRIRFYETDRFLNAELNRIIKSTIADTISITILLSFLLFMTIRYVVLRPISDIATAIHKRDSDGIPLNKLPKYKVKEIYSLSKSMNNMIDSIRTSRNDIQTEKNRFQLVIDGAKLGYWDWNYQEGTHLVNDTWLSMLGLTQKDIVGTEDDWSGLIHPEDAQRVAKVIEAHIKSKESYVVEFRMKHTQGHWVWIQGSGAVVEYDNTTGEPIRLCGTHQNITVRKEAEEKLKLSARVYSDTLEGIIITDANAIIVDVNPAFCEITGYSTEEAIGKSPNMLSAGIQGAEFYQNMWRTIEETSHWQGEVWNSKKSGELYAQMLTISVLKDDNGQVSNYIGVFTDITQSKRQQEELSKMAHYDVLTGLPNRSLFGDRFHQAVAHSKRTHKKLGICFLDLDNFKPINDNFGHDVGDQILIEVSVRIMGNMRGEDTVSRQGGDEFALLFNDLDSFEECEQTLARIHNALAEPYYIDGSCHHITASSGVTLYPDDDGDVDTLLRHADQAMYKAKLAGKQHYQLFNPELDLKIIEKHHKVEEIETALANAEFQLYYQPKVNMVTGEVFGVEALIRWVHPTKGVISPSEFLPFIEGTHLEIDIGNWVIHEAICQLQKWHNSNVIIEISVNISSQHLLSGSFYKVLEEALHMHPSVEAKYLQIEILESSALGDLNAISSIIKTCQETLGIRAALDDFGTGYSSLTHLRRLPVDVIKIDQSFIKGMLDDPSDYAIIDGVIGLADAFNREVIAEGVEVIEHGLMLLLMGCDKAQGNFVSKPMKHDELIIWMNNYKDNEQWHYFGSKHRTNLENKVELFKLVTNRWKDKFIACVEANSVDIKHWPILNSKHCPCGIWLKRAKQEKLFAVEQLALLDKAHDNLHLIANRILFQYQNGDIELARKGLSELSAAFDVMQMYCQISPSSIN